MRLLDKFRSTLPSAYAKQVLQKVEENIIAKKDLTTEEYRKILTDFSVRVDQNNFIPRFKQLFAQPYQMISSEVFNQMVSWAKDDLSALFNELNTILVTLDAHSELFDDRIINQAEFLINKLSKMISSLMFISGYPEFNDAVSDDFSDLSQTKLDQNALSNLFKDPRTGAIYPLCSVNFLSGYLTLPISIRTVYGPIEMKILREIQPDLADDRIPGSGNQQGTNIDQESESVSYTVTSETQLTSPARLVLSVNFGGPRKCNGLSISTSSPKPVFLSGLIFVNGVLRETYLLSSPIRLVSSTQIAFPERMVSGLELEILQSSGTQKVFDLKNDYSAGQLLTDNDTTRVISESIEKNIPSEPVRQMIGLQKTKKSETGMFIYEFGVDNVTLEQVIYNRTGIFVGKSKVFKNPGLIGLVVKSIPVEERVSLEYYIYKTDKLAGKNASTEIIPILPLGTEQVNNELLIVSGGQATTRFRAHGFGFSDFTGPTQGSIKNNQFTCCDLTVSSYTRPPSPIDLTQDTDWKVILTEQGEIASRYTRIQVEETAWPAVGPVNLGRRYLLASYKPFYATVLEDSPIKIGDRFRSGIDDLFPIVAADQGRKYRYRGDGGIEFIGNDTIDFESEIGLMVVMRYLDFGDVKTPMLDNYTLGVCQIDVDTLSL